MNIHRVSWLTLTAFALLASACSHKRPAEGLRVTYGQAGLQKLTFNGIALEDTERYSEDAFHIWHMKTVDAKGVVLTDKEYGWGDFAKSKVWDSASRTWTYSFSWGAISLQYNQRGDTLDLTVTEKNNSGSGITLDGATVYPMVLHFPDLPKGFVDSSFQHLVVRPNEPAPVADWGEGQVSMTTNETRPLYRGFEPAKGSNNFYPVISSTSMDSLPQGFARVDRPVQPGGTETFTVSLVFKQSPQSAD